MECIGCTENLIAEVKQNPEYNLNNEVLVSDAINNGITLKEVVKTHGKIHPNIIFSMMQPIMEFLAKIHDMGLYHGRISPATLVVKYSSYIQLSSVLKGNDILLSGEVLKDSLRLVGCPDKVSLIKKGIWIEAERYPYADIDEYDPNGAKGEWIDIYGICTVIYFAITGIEPPGIIERAMGQIITDPLTLGVDIDSRLNGVIMRGTTRHPLDRWSKMSQICYNVGSILNTKEEKAFFKGGSELMIDEEKEIPYMFRKKLKRESICSVVFTDEMNSVPRGAWDVSKNKNRSVLAWVVKQGDLYELTIAGKGGVKAGKDLCQLFANCINLKKVEFNNKFDTSSAIEMGEMFSGCERLEELDMSGLDTRNVAYMDTMFSRCYNLKKVNLTNLNTSNVKFMDDMFEDCHNLEEIDVSQFVTDKVTRVAHMFKGCKRLKTLNLSGFNLNSLERKDEIETMLEGCESLQEVNIIGWNLLDVGRVMRGVDLYPTIVKWQ